MALGARSVSIVLRLAFLAVVLATFTVTQADPDLWGHVRFGHDIIAARSLPKADPYSFTSDRPWINHEWLAECVIYLAYAVAGGVGLIALKLALLLGMLLGVVVISRLRPLSWAATDGLVGLVFVATIPQAHDVRPQLFSLVLFTWLLALVLMATTDGKLWRLWLAVPLMALWANLHGGWLVGAGTLILWASAGLWTQIPRREKRDSCLVAAVSLAATLLTPYGWGLWAFLRETVGFNRANIVEWLSILQVFRVAPLVTMTWVLVAIAALVALRPPRTIASSDPRALGVVLALGAASFRINRLLAFFAISVAALMGPQLAAAIAMCRPRSTRSRQASPRATMALGALGLVIVAGGVTLALANARCVGLDPDEVPEPEVVALIHQRGLHGRMVTWFNWGEYAIWHLAPSISVSFDGRRETVYSDATIAEAVRFYTRSSERHSILARLKPEYIWLPSSLDLVRDLQSDGWVPLFSGSRSVLLGQTGSSAPTPRAAGLPAARCFPGP